MSNNKPLAISRLSLHPDGSPKTTKEKIIPSLLKNKESRGKILEHYAGMMYVFFHIIENYWVHSDDEPESNIEFMGYKARITATEGGYFGWFENPGVFHVDSPVFSEHHLIVSWCEEMLISNIMLEALTLGMS